MTNIERNYMSVEAFLILFVKLKIITAAEFCKYAMDYNERCSQKIKESGQ